MSHLKKLIDISAYSIFIFLLLISSSVFAQDSRIEIVKNRKQAIANLTTAIHSENQGLRRSAIYFAGKYKITEMVPEIIEELKTEEEPAIRFQIFLVLYEIGDDDGLKYLKQVSNPDENERVRHIGKAIAKAISK